MKKTVLKALALTLCAGALYGCAQYVPQSGMFSGNGLEPSSSEQASVQPVTLKIWQRKVEITEAFQELLDAYTRRNPHVTFETERPGGNNYYSTIKVMLASGVEPDIISLRPGNTLEEYYQNGHLVDLTEENFNVTQEALAAVSINGRVAALPMDFAGVGVIYNKQLFFDAGISEIPRTVTELKSACEKLKTLGVTPFGVNYKDDWALYQLFSLIAGAVGGPEQLATGLNGESVSFQTDAIDMAFSVLDCINVNCNENSFDSDYNNQVVLFAQGEVAMIPQGLWAISNLAKVNPNLQTGLFALPFSDDPQDTKMAGGVDYTLSIYGQSKNADEAKAFLRWLATREAVDIWRDKCGLLSTVKEAVPPSLPHSTVSQDILGYFAKKAVYPLGYMGWSDSFIEEVVYQMRAYCSGQTTRKGFCADLERFYRDKPQ